MFQVNLTGIELKFLVDLINSHLAICEEMYAFLKENFESDGLSSVTSDLDRLRELRDKLLLGMKEVYCE